MRFRFLLLLTGGLLLCAAGPPAGAAKFLAGLGSIKITARPGQVVTRAYQLTLKKSERPTRFKFTIEDWWRSEDGKQSFYAAPGTLQRSCGKWVTVNPVEAVAQPGATLTARLTIGIPKPIANGGYWCVLTVDEVPDPLDAPAGVGARFVASVSTGIFVYLNPLDRAADFVDVRINPSEAAVTLRNRGNTPLGVDGRFEFLRNGKAVAVVPIPRGTLLPEPVQTATFTAALPAPDVLPSGRYLARVVIDIGLDHNLGLEREVDVVRGVVPAPVPDAKDEAGDRRPHAKEP